MLVRDQKDCFCSQNVSVGNKVLWTMRCISNIVLFSCLVNCSRQSVSVYSAVRYVLSTVNHEVSTDACAEINLRDPVFPPRNVPELSSVSPRHWRFELLRYARVGWKKVYANLSWRLCERDFPGSVLLEMESSMGNWMESYILNGRKPTLKKVRDADSPWFEWFTTTAVKWRNW